MNDDSCGTRTISRRVPVFFTDVTVEAGERGKWGIICRHLAYVQQGLQPRCSIDTRSYESRVSPAIRCNRSLSHFSSSFSQLLHLHRPVSFRSTVFRLPAVLTMYSASIVLHLMQVHLVRITIRGLLEGLIDFFCESKISMRIIMKLIITFVTYFLQEFFTSQDNFRDHSSKTPYS